MRKDNHFLNIFSFRFERVQRRTVEFRSTVNEIAISWMSTLNYQSGPLRWHFGRNEIIETVKKDAVLAKRNHRYSKKGPCSVAYKYGYAFSFSWLIIWHDNFVFVLYDPSTRQLQFWSNLSIKLNARHPLK